MTAKKTYITVLNVYSCLSVVLLHGDLFWVFRKTPGWIADNFVESFFYFAVPVFVMLSGATLMDYRDRYTTAEYFKKRVRKTVIPFLFWSIVGLLFIIWRDGSGSVDLRPTAILDAVINCRYIGIYYFFIIIFCVYLAIPVFSAIPKEKRQRTFLYCILVALAVNILLPFLASLTGGAVHHNGNFSFSVCGGYLFYALIGYYLDAYTPSRKVRILLYLLGLFGFAALFLGTLLLSYRDDAINALFKEYVNWPCALYATAVFLFFKTFPFDKLPQWLLKVLTFSAGQTFGIYLIHVQLIMFFNKALHIVPQSFAQRMGFALLIFVLSGLLTKLMQKIPVLKHLIP